MIVLGGVIGAGKTALTGRLAKHLGSKPFYEPVKQTLFCHYFIKEIN